MSENITTENKIQQNSIKLLQSLGYEFVSKSENVSLRDGRTSNVLLKSILQEQLNAINSYDYKSQKYKFSENNISKAINDLDIGLNEGLMVANERITNHLLLGTSYEESLNDGQRKSFSLKYIHFDNV